MPVLFWSGVGVKVAVRVRPVPEMAERLPPETVISERVKVVPGSSEKVNVMFAVSPALRVATLLLIATVGATVSMVIVRAVLVFELPAISVAFAVRLWLPFERLAVGVKLQMPELLAVVVPRTVPVTPPS